ncbi:MAG: 4-hydroxybenzoate polyprenyltransferase [Thermoplasmatales archaeon SG8-52-3]|nr:MAG: 4-hydroxybenzoate polyprenyltransferase [Thermoplasmatales archaeon SG8-52-3]
MKIWELKTYFKNYFDLIRPFTLLAPIIVSSCIMIASYFNNKVLGDFSIILWTTVLPASFALAILNGASNTLNQVTDIKTDKISKPYRPLIKSNIPIENALIISILLYSLAIFISLFINPTFLFLILLISFFSITYSIPPRFKDVIFVNQLWIAIPRGLLGILASWSVFGNPFNPLPLVIGLIAMCFLVGGSITKDIVDKEADKKTGTKTLVNTFGIKKAATLSLPFMIFPFCYIPMLIHSGILESYLWILTFLSIPAFLIFYLMIKENRKEGLLENTPSWTLMYVTYFFFAFGFSVLTVISSISA